MIHRINPSDSMALTEEHWATFSKWLKCYGNPNMNMARDHNARTIWFKVRPIVLAYILIDNPLLKIMCLPLHPKGEAGAMCPKSELL